MHDARAWAEASAEKLIIDFVKRDASFKVVQPPGAYPCGTAQSCFVHEIQCATVVSKVVRD